MTSSNRDGAETHVARLPLAGVRVLDLTRALAGPFATMILGDLGATVVKIEPADGGDMTRTWGSFAAGQSIYYLSANLRISVIADACFSLKADAVSA